MRIAKTKRPTCALLIAVLLLHQAWVAVVHAGSLTPLNSHSATPNNSHSPKPKPPSAGGSTPAKAQAAKAQASKAQAPKAQASDSSNESFHSATSHSPPSHSPRVDTVTDRRLRKAAERSDHLHKLSYAACRSIFDAIVVRSNGPLPAIVDEQVKKSLKQICVTCYNILDEAFLHVLHNIVSSALERPDETANFMNSVKAFVNQAFAKKYPKMKHKDIGRLFAKWLRLE